MSVDETVVELWHLRALGGGNLIRATPPDDPDARVETNLFRFEWNGKINGWCLQNWQQVHTILWSRTSLEGFEKLSCRLDSTRRWLCKVIRQVGIRRHFTRAESWSWGLISHEWICTQMYYSMLTWLSGCLIMPTKKACPRLREIPWLMLSNTLLTWGRGKISNNLHSF